MFKLLWPRGEAAGRLSSRRGLVTGVIACGNGGPTVKIVIGREEWR